MIGKNCNSYATDDRGVVLPLLAWSMPCVIRGIGDEKRGKKPQASIPVVKAPRRVTAGRTFSTRLVA